MANLASIAMLAELEGVLAVDKPAGIAAHDVMHEIKRHYNLVKVGHGGTLAGNVSGLFVVLVGDATRVQNEFMNADCVYEGVIRLGVVTKTSDRDGEVIERKDASSVTSESLKAVLPELKGDVFLSEPEFSAVKIPGHDGYDIVKTGDGSAARLYHVYSLVCEEPADGLVKFRLSCTKGLPVRSLVVELGNLLGCGASLDSLRRVKVGKLVVEDAITFAKLLTSPVSALPDAVRPVHSCL